MYIADFVLQSSGMNLLLRKRSNRGFILIFIQLLMGIADFLLRCSRTIKQAQTKRFHIFVLSGMIEMLQNRGVCYESERVSLQELIDPERLLLSFIHDNQKLNLSLWKLKVLQSCRQNVAL